MRRLLAMVLLGFLGGLLGCASSGALERGHALVGGQQYRAAIEAYREALAEDPEDEAAQRALAQIVPYAVDEGQRDTSSAVSEGRWEEATAHAAYVASLDPQRGAALRAEVVLLMRASLETLLLGKQMDRAYVLAARARRIEPDMKGLDGVFTRLREHYLAESARLADAANFAEALAALDTIEEHEPHTAAWLSPKKRSIRVRWADATLARALAAESDGSQGEAAALYARAFEIAQRAHDGDQMRRLLRELRQEGMFWLTLDVDASPRLASLVEARAVAIDGVALNPDRTGSRMIAAATASPVSCDQRETTSSASQEYIAGHRDVPNPAWTDLDREAQALRARLAGLAHEASQGADEANRWRREARETHQRRCQPAERALDAAEQAVCDEATRQADSAQRRASDARAALVSAEAELAVLERRLGDTPRTLSEPTYDTFHYDVRHVTRGCAGELSLSLERVWSSPTKSVIAGHADTSDTTHPGFPRYGVEEDPLELGRSDGDLRAAADEALASNVAAALLADVSDFYRQMAQRALDEADPATSTAMMLALHAAAPKQIAGVQRAAFAKLLQRRYGLESIATLTR